MALTMTPVIYTFGCMWILLSQSISKKIGCAGLDTDIGDLISCMQVDIGLSDPHA